MALRDIDGGAGKGHSKLSPRYQRKIMSEIICNECSRGNKEPKERKDGIRVTVRKIYEKGGIETVKKLVDEYNEKRGREIYPFEKVQEWIEEDISKGHIQPYNIEKTNKGRDDDDESR